MSAAVEGRFVRARRGLVAPLVLLAAWYLVAHFGLANAHIVVGPGAVLAAALTRLREGEIFGDLAASLQRDLLGFVLGAILGVTAGAAFGASRIANALLGPTFHGAKQVAIFAWIPLMSCWFGTGELAKVVFVALSAFYPIALNTHEGVESIGTTHWEVANVFSFSRFATLRLVVLPAAAPSIFAGLRLGLVYAWLGTLGAEFLLAPGRGIGNVLISGRQRVAMDDVFLGIVLVGALGFVFDRLAARVEERALQWRPKHT